MKKILNEKNNKNNPAIVKLKVSGIALLYAYSLSSLNGYHHVPHNNVESTIA